MIYIHKGDDTDFNDNSFLTFNIVTEKDLTNWQAKFVLNGVEKTFEDISSKSFELHFSDDETCQFKLGKTTNELRLIDKEGKIKTVAKNIEICVTSEIVENQSQIINLPILKDEGIDINISLANGGSNGTIYHTDLLNRDMENQHPINAITNLQETLDNKANKNEIPSLDDYVTNTELENKGYLTQHQDISNLATKDELETKQATLISGTNIKTINNESILGSGNIEIKQSEGGSSSFSFPLGASFYFANIQPSSSFLKSSGQWNDGGKHETAYNWLVEEKANNTSRKDIKDVSENYGDFDFVLNQSEKTFRLPLKNGSENLTSTNFENMTLGATDTSYVAPANGWVCLCKVVKATNQYIQIVAPTGTEPAKATSSSDWLYATKEVGRGETYKVQYTASGDTKFFKFCYAKGNGDLYYYVGDVAE